MCNLVVLKHYSKPYHADFSFVEIDKMLMLIFFFNETTNPREIKKKSNQLLRYINDDVIAEIDGSRFYVTMKL